MIINTNKKGITMKRVKWNLDMLEEVRQQHEKAMNATEQVINNARNDLNSMTEEVWEGEDGDMARELLGDLVYKEMPQTWKELDTINSAIIKAQKDAYKSKNFCNGFHQIFREGTMPSETDSSLCSGNLMCDNASCDALKASMEAAGNNARNVKSKIEIVENLLAELETDEAKFEYSSYTEPVKTQAQNVADRVQVFNKAVTRYEHKVGELDTTLSKELIDAIPTTAPKPFDPSVLMSGDLVHMNGGDIINSLEEHSRIDLGDKYITEHIQNILEILFGKNDVDLSTLTKENLEIAFVHLVDDQKAELLNAMGLSSDYVDQWRQKTNSVVNINNNNYYGGMTPCVTPPSLEDLEKIAEALGLTIEQVELILKGYIPENVSNDTVVKVMQYVAVLSIVDPFTILIHLIFNGDEIDKVYNSGEYIENQSMWSEVGYAYSDMAYSGCGIIAIINALHSLGINFTNDQVAELIFLFEEYGNVAGAKLGTSPMAIVDYFENYTNFDVKYTTSTKAEDIQKIAKDCDTFIVEIYNDGDDITDGMHYVNIEKKEYENGEVKYIVHNAGNYKDKNGNGRCDEDEYIEYDSLEKAIQEAGYDGEGQSVIIIGLDDPTDIEINEEESIITDAPDKEEKTC